MEINKWHKEKSADQLSRSMDKKFRTTFIGALSAFEKAFGYLWGDLRPEEELTDEEYNYRKVWENVRTNVLNNGNNQRRAAQAELSEYTVDWNGYSVNFIIKDRRD